MTDGSCTWGEHSIINTLAQSLCCMPETNVTLYVNCISVTKKVKQYFSFISDSIRTSESFNSDPASPNLLICCYFPVLFIVCGKKPYTIGHYYCIQKIFV